ncbi:MAG: hypothetical protein EOO99_02665 [Pedobacter sp.]|nr:MAG: hypothetical protein EOO99_02665 [Pedobacter sp.]
MKNVAINTNPVNFKEIPGWGMDVDIENEPTYPMKHYTGDDHSRSGYDRSITQTRDVEILMSNERPQISAVHGNTVPPSGLSGLIRRYAFQHSEDRYRHWLPLILADRINMFEGLIEDFRKGYVPNFIEERGLRMEVKHNLKGLVSKMITTAAIGYGLYLLCRKRK